MNIIVKPQDGGFCYCRPDTTWERENKDFYVPDGVDEIRWAPIAFVRISKAGKCIGEKFVSRYYDEFNYGALLYCCMDGHDDIAFTSCVDHTSILPAPLHAIAEMDKAGNICEVRKNGTTIFKNEGLNKEVLEDAICKASKMTSLRIGDYVAVELAPAGVLASRKEGETRISADRCGDNLFDLKVIF